jgi:hypothetical protein
MTTTAPAVSGETAIMAGHDASRELAMRDLRDASQWGAADPEVVTATGTRIADGDPDAWLREWRGDAARYLHAASYYAAALAVIADTDGSVDEAQLWDRQRDCWDRAASALGGERVFIPYENTTLPGLFFSGGRGRRPLVVVDPGGRAATSHAWARAGAAARARGYHWMTFDGPGRQAALRRQGLVLRPDWEAVLAPVADAMTAHVAVDASRMAAVGVELGAFGVTRALAYEHRFAAAVAAPGIVDAARPWIDALPAAARVALLEDDRARFDAELHLADLFVPETSDRLRREARCFDLSGLAMYDLYRRIQTFRLGPEAELITTPVLAGADGEHPFWPGQSAALRQRLGDRAFAPGDAGGTGADGIMRWLESCL